MPPPTTKQVNNKFKAEKAPTDLEMPLVDHLEELRQRIFKSIISIIFCAGGCLILVKPIVRLLEAP